MNELNKADVNTILRGVFSTNEWISNDVKGMTFQRVAEDETNRKFFVSLNPYEAITDCGMTPVNLEIGVQIIDKDGIILEVFDIGSSGLFDGNNISWIWIGFSAINTVFSSSK
jgi:hypothetical protein